MKDKIVRLYKETRVYTRRMELTREEAKRHPGVARPVKDPRFRKAPVFIIVCGDPRTEECYPLSAKREKTFNSSLASAVLYIHLAATALGLGSQWVSVSGSPLMATQLKDLLGIPRIFEIYDMIAVGYPAERPKPRHYRKLDEIAHYERYDKKKFRTDADISDFIATVHKA
jgi:nitroreductase